MGIALLIKERTQGGDANKKQRTTQKDRKMRKIDLFSSNKPIIEGFQARFELCLFNESEEKI